MTRYKKYLRDKGIKLECDYPIIPDPETYLTDVLIDITNDYIIVTNVYVMGAFTALIGRNGNIY